jgi:hypothetical protein
MMSITVTEFLIFVFKIIVDIVEIILCFQTGSGAHPASCTVGTGGSFPGVKRGRGVMLTTHPLLVPRLKKSRSYTSCHPNAHLWSVTGPLYIFLVKIIDKIVLF